MVDHGEVALLTVASMPIVTRCVRFGTATYEVFTPDSVRSPASFDPNPGAAGGSDDEDEKDALESFLEAYRRFEQAKTKTRSLCPRPGALVTLNMEFSSLWQARMSRSDAKTQR
eukprot:TRINITY_DN48763_c0_g1_i1.p1 TRINITY_DN48763_c0_g1~~TRINITY_DN48763_c0_g1_i1.p1  ORF type:complete len:134 (-),score=24.60 TRINITY_DN48763_c0_g1_i1:504-845(-)